MGGRTGGGGGGGRLLTPPGILVQEPTFTGRKCGKVLTHIRKQKNLGLPGTASNGEDRTHSRAKRSLKQLGVSWGQGVQRRRNCKFWGGVNADSSQVRNWSAFKKGLRKTTGTDKRGREKNVAVKMVARDPECVGKHLPVVVLTKGGVDLEPVE